MTELIAIDTPPRLADREADAHKGDFGRLLVVGGSVGMVGAPALAANAALRSGSGLVTIASPMLIQQSVAILAPCATSFPLPQSNTGTLSEESLEVIRSLTERNDVLAVGCGLGRHLELAAIARWLVRDCDRPAVIDADGLNALAEQTDWFPVNPPIVLTPHPGEMRRLMDSVDLSHELNSTPESRRNAAIALAQAADCVVVLKGHQSVVTDGRRIYINTNGNPGMATAGTGDVLTGTIAALLGQRLPPMEAAVLGTFIHGLAGDLAAEALGFISLTATDLIDHLPLAWQKHQHDG